MGRKRKEEGMGFSRFLSGMRQAQGVTLEALAAGICDVSRLARIEKGERPVEKALRDRLMGRLGFASDRHENILNVTDYALWQRQNAILDCVEQKDAVTGNRLLAAYEAELTADAKIELQFCLTMRAQFMEQQGASEMEIGAVYEQAVRLTVPEIDTLDAAAVCLSVQEWNLVLAYKWYHRNECTGRELERIVTALEASCLDNRIKAKVCPRAVVYELWYALEQERLPETELLHCLKLCNRQIELLRDAGRAYYLWELLDQREKILCRIDRKGDAESYRKLRQQNLEWLKMLEWLYCEFGVPREMQDCVYLYRWSDVFCISDVLRTRREMLGMSQEELCEGICSVKTLRRAERGETNMQTAALGLLMERLGLSGEAERTEIVTDSREAQIALQQLTIYESNYEIEHTRQVLEQIKEMIPMEHPSNRQFVLETEAYLDFWEKLLSREKYVEAIKRALECTLPYEALFRRGKKYLTNAEITCVRNMALQMDVREKFQHLQIIWDIYREYEEQNKTGCYSSMYKFVMYAIASELGNVGRFDESDAMSRKILLEGLKCKRMMDLDGSLYNIVWNHRERRKKGQSAGTGIDEQDYLKKCTTLAELFRETHYVDFYKKVEKKWGVEG